MSTVAPAARPRNTATRMMARIWVEEVWASSTRAMIWFSVVSAPTRVARNRNEPDWEALAGQQLSSLSVIANSALLKRLRIRTVER